MLLRTDKFNALASDLDLDVLDQTQTDIVYPLGVSAHGGHVDLQVDAVDQIAVTADLGSYATAEAGLTIDVYTPPFGVFSGGAPTLLGTRLYLKQEGSRPFLPTTI